MTILSNEAQDEIISQKQETISNIEDNIPEQLDIVEKTNNEEVLVEKNLSSLQVKSFSISEAGFQGQIEAYACTYGNVDRDGEVMVKGCFNKWFSNPENRRNIRFFGGHDRNASIGSHISEIDTDQGLKVKAEIYEEAKNNAHVPYRKLVEKGEISQLSVGFICVDSYIEKGIKYITEAQLMEYSLVPIPANPRAKILSRKSFDGKENASLFADVKSIEELKVVLKSSCNFTDDDVDDLEKTISKFNYKANLLKNVKSMADRDKVLKKYYDFQDADLKALKRTFNVTKTNDFLEVLQSIEKKFNLDEEASMDLKNYFLENKWLDDLETKACYNAQISTQGSDLKEEDDEEEKKKKELQEMEEEMQQTLKELELIELEKKVLDI